jgi:hypothetical protein
MKLKIKSTLNPAICNNRIIGGTILEVNGEKWDHPYVGFTGTITLDDVEWVRPGVQVVTTEIKEWKVKSSKAGKFYTVRQGLNGKRTCDCDGFMYRRKCRHVKEVD